MMVALFAIMYFLMIRPQQKKAKEHQSYLSNLKKGDKVKVLIKKLYTIDENTTNILVNKALDDSELYYI